MSEQGAERYAQFRRRRHARRGIRRIGGSHTFNRILRVTLGLWLVRRYRVTTDNLEAVKRLKPPFLVLPNHGCVLDPFFVNAFVPGVIHYVVSDANFRTKIVEIGLGLVGSIPKTKVMSDLDTVKNIMRVKEAGGIVGIFPEGQSTWDGHTMPLYYSTAKLAKVLRVPVVTARVQGAFMSKPRWSRSRRRGRITIRYDVAYMPDELRKATVAEIDARIAKLLEHDEYEYNARVRQRFLGVRRAEYAEIALFTCPSCGSFATMRSEGNRFGCTSCGYAVRYDTYGFFKPVSGALRFSTMREWSLWQTDELYRRLERYVTKGSGAEPLWSETSATIQIGYKSMPLEHYRKGRIELYPDRMQITEPNGADEAFSIGEIEGINVQNRERLEFYVRDSLYRVTIDDPRGCTYKWDLAIRRMRELAASMAVV